MTKWSSKTFAVALAFAVALFTGSWSRILSPAILLASPIAPQEKGQQQDEKGGQNQQGKNEGEHEDTGAAANDSHEDKDDVDEKAEANDKNDKDKGEVETANDTHDRDEAQEDRQDDQQQDAHEGAESVSANQ